MIGVHYRFIDKEKILPENLYTWFQKEATIHHVTREETNGDFTTFSRRRQKRRGSAASSNRKRKRRDQPPLYFLVVIGVFFAGLVGLIRYLYRQLITSPHSNAFGTELKRFIQIKQIFVCIMLMTLENSAIPEK